MGRIKELLNDIDISNEDIEMDLFQRNEDLTQYEEWLNSDGFVEYVNGEIDMTKSRYSEIDVTSAIRYASNQIIIDPNEVGKEVYDMLFSEKIEEYLSLYGG